mgnify:CR=1 FL=1
MVFIKSSQTYSNFLKSTNKDNDVIKHLRSLIQTIIDYDEIQTFQFASTCKNIILSHGTFSAMIGYLGFFSNVYFPNKNPRWCPLGLFSNKGFIPITIS